MENLQIQFNIAVIKKIKSFNFQVDQIGSILFILFALYENKIALLDEFDDFNKQKRAYLLYKEMEVRSLVALNKEVKVKSHYTLTKKGIELVEYIRSQFMESPISTEKLAVLGSEQLTEAIAADDVSTWIDEWIDIFPRSVKSGGKLVRGDKLSCERKMRVFLKEYKYEKDIILAATRAYVASKEQEGYAYMTCAVYFIYKMDIINRDKVSDLASWCDQMIHEKSKGDTQSENNLEIMA